MPSEPVPVPVDEELGDPAVEFEPVLLPVADLAVYYRNPRRGNVGAIAESLAKHGQFRPLVVNRGTLTGRGLEVLCGNHTLLAARHLGWSHLHAWVFDVDDDVAARIVAIDNRTSDLAEYDDQALLELLASLPTLDGTGYTPDDYDALLAAVEADLPGANRTDPDDAPEAPTDPLSRPGDVWSLGAHRLVVGDSTDPATVDLALAGTRADLVFTDPPYGVDYEGKTKAKLRIRNDALTATKLGELLVAAFTRVHDALRPGGAFYICSPSGELETVFRLALDAAGLRLRQQIVWAKNTFVLGRSDYHLQHESIHYGWTDGATPEPLPLYDVEHDTVLYGWRSGAAHTWEGGRKQSSLWTYDKPAASRLHPTMKPVELVKRAILNSSQRGGVVLDLFGGSGSTLIAAHHTGRRAALVELDPAYADVICRRWQEHTGVVPTRDGEPVDFVTP